MYRRLCRTKQSKEFEKIFPGGPLVISAHRVLLSAYLLHFVPTYILIEPLRTH
jgi:hypothetical protein